MPRYEEDRYYEKEHIIRHTFFQMMMKPKMLNEVISYYNINKDIINLSDDDRTRLPSIINYDNYKLIEWCIDVLGVKVDNINYYLQKWIHSSRIFPFLVNKYYQDRDIPIYVNIYDNIAFLYQLSPKSFTNDVWSGILLSNVKRGVINIILWILKTYRFKLTERLAIKCIKKLFYGDITLIKEIIFYMMLHSKRSTHKKRHYKTYPPYVLCSIEKKMKIFI